MAEIDPVSGFVEVSDGVRLRYSQYGPPSAPNLVLIPGWAQTAAEFRKQVDHFKPSFRVTTYDHRGLKMPLPLAAALLVDHSSMDWRDVIPRIDVPTLVIGAKGSLFPTQGIQWIADQIPGANLRVFEKEEGGSHFVMWENPEGFNKVVEEFLTS